MINYHDHEQLREERSHLVVRENCLYSVNHVLNKTLVGQAGGVGGKTSQEVEMMQREQENSGEEEVDFSQSCPDHRRSNM